MKKGFNARSKQRGFKKKTERDMDKNKYVDKKKAKRAKKADQVKEEENVSDIEMNEDSDVVEVEKVDPEQENYKQTGELDLPGDDTSEEEIEEELEPMGDDSELEDYYKELGIDEDGDIKNRKKKHAKKEDEPMYETKPKKEKVERKKSEVIDTMLEKARTETDYKTLQRVIQLIKTVFSATKDVEPEDQQD